MNDMTAANLRSAFGGESMAHMRYLVWSDVAAEEGYPNVARLFRAISRAEQVHASNHFETLRDVSGPFLVPSMAGFGLGGTADNLDGAIEGETFEINQMYPAYKEVAKSQGEKQANVSFYYALSAEKVHQQMFGQAKEEVLSGRDMELGKVQICEVCGHTLEGEAPQKCPICGAASEKYITYE